MRRKQGTQERGKHQKRVAIWYIHYLGQGNALECSEENVSFISAIKSRTEFSGLPLLASFGHRRSNVANRDVGACPGPPKWVTGSTIPSHLSYLSHEHVFARARAYGIIVITRRCARLLANKKPSKPTGRLLHAGCSRLFNFCRENNRSGRTVKAGNNRFEKLAMLRSFMRLFMKNCYLAIHDIEC